MYRILLVEDDINIQTLIANYFTKKEKDVFQVDIASDGQTGLEKAYEHHYDLLLLDVNRTIVAIIKVSKVNFLVIIFISSF